MHIPEFGPRRKRHAYRFSAAILLASVIWGAFLVSSTRLFAGDEPAPRAPEAMEMRVVELPPPAPAAAPATYVGPKVAPWRSGSAVPKTVPARPAKPVRPVEQTSLHDALPAQQAAPSAPTQTAKASPDDTRLASVTDGQSAPTPSAATGNTPARLISQPLPTLPDDLREESYQAVAVARFLVHADGTFDIDLVKATRNPRLNQILLETLRRWRFSPAMESGRPVESRRDVRVHFNVN